ncbi:MAG: glycoside hydrolase family protein [Cypionkella sp.]
MQTSDQGRDALKGEEGEVLKAYRDVAGFWTIGVGLTAASGVIKPVSGMTITREQSDRLLTEALKVRYEPAVEMAMIITTPALERPRQNAFDAGVSFHWNTGAIARATWVKLWKARAARSAIFAALGDWSKAGGKVLPSLKARRNREAMMLLDGVYRVTPAASDPHPVFAQWGLALSPSEIVAVFVGLRQLGYDPGDGTARVRRDAVTKFQHDHDLTADGIIGRATLTTLQRALDARSKAALPVAAAVVVPAASVAGLTDQVAAIPHADAAAIAAAGLWLFSHAWAYRDIVAAQIAPVFPRIAAYLRSF